MKKRKIFKLIKIQHTKQQNMHIDSKIQPDMVREK